MFNIRSINTAEVNAPAALPGVPVLSILASEDVSVLSWTSPYNTDFFTLYWSDNPFESIDETGVHAITEEMPTPGIPPDGEVSYTHTIPARFSLYVLYYRVAARNSNGATLSNQVTNYNYKLAIYEELYKKTLDDLTLRFTPEIRQQYEDSQLWRSFVQSLCSELAQSRFEIKEALKQLNLQKAVDVFLNMWNSVIGISRENVTDSATEELRPETDEEYRQRLVDNVFWDKISNLALKKTMLLKLGRDATILDAGEDASAFKTLPEQAIAKLFANQGLMYFPNEIMTFEFVGPDYTATCVSDDGTTLVYSNYSGPDAQPDLIRGGNTSGFFRAIPTAPLQPGLIELISKGDFPVAGSIQGWVNKDSGAEGPPSPDIVTFRPTTHATSGNGTVQNPGYAYDINTDSFAYIFRASDFTSPPRYARIDVYGFPVQPAGSPDYLELKIKINIPFTSVYPDNPSAFTWLIYSLDDGGTWLYPPISANLLNPPYPPRFSGIVSVPLPLSQNLSLVRVATWNEYHGAPTYLYDVRIEGSGFNAAGLSDWSAEYGGTMKLRYGVAAREYIIASTAGQDCYLYFEVKGSGTVIYKVGTTSGASDLATGSVSPGVYGPINFTASDPTYLRFDVSGTAIGYVDNVSVLGEGPITSGTLIHDAIYNQYGFWVTTPGTKLTFVSQDGLTTTYGKFISNIGGVLTFERYPGSDTPSQYDYIKADRPVPPVPILNHLAVLLTEPEVVTSSSSLINPKLLSNIYSVNLGVVSLPDSVLNEIYDAISPLGAIGNVLTMIIQDVIASFDDWDTTFGNIPYGPIFMGIPYDATAWTTGGNWVDGVSIYVSNRWDMSTTSPTYLPEGSWTGTPNGNRLFDGNDGPDDIVVLTLQAL